jgi:hypothetical protein
VSLLGKGRGVSCELGEARVEGDIHCAVETADGYCLSWFICGLLDRTKGLFTAGGGGERSVVEQQEGERAEP